MLYSKIIRAVKSHRFIEAVRSHMAYIILPKNEVIISSMRALPDDIILRSRYPERDYVRISTLELMAYEINKNNVAGSCAELGVYQGNFASCINRAFPERDLYLFDTFEGFADSDVLADISSSYSQGDQDFSNTSVECVLKKMQNPMKCKIRKGWFPQSAEGLDDITFCFVSLDADLHDPIYAGLKFFYPKMERGGVIFVHDFNNRNYLGTKKAVEEFVLEENVPYCCLPDCSGSVVIMKN